MRYTKVLIFISLFNLASFEISANDSIKQKVIKALGLYAKEIDYFPEKLFDKHSNEVSVLINQLENQNTTREKINSEYRELKKQYYSWGIKTILEEKDNSKDRRPASVEFSSNKCELSKKIAFSLIPFKRGDLSSQCERVVNEGVKQGLDVLTLFYPVHYSGGNSSGDYKMPPIPEYGRDYQYETANAPSNEELVNCLDYIDQKKLKLRFVPHLESIAQLSGKNEEWRLKSGIPIDANYYQFAFGPFLKYLEQNPKAFRNHDLYVTVAAEIDPIVLTQPEATSKIVQSLRKDLKALNIKHKVFWNSNGDFYNGWDLPQVKDVKVNCLALDGLMSSLDGLTPSMYGDNQHLSFDTKGKLDGLGSIAGYLEKLQIKLKDLCGDYKFNFVHKSRVGFGELAISADDVNQSYEDLFANLKNNRKFIGVNFWNQGKWDHLGISYPEGETKKPPTDLKQFLNQCQKDSSNK